MVTKTNIFETTKSLCPVCKEKIDAGIVEEGGSIYMCKTCAAHGDFKVLISKYSWYYRGLNRLYEALFPQGHCLQGDHIKNIQFHPTARCNLQCPVCYSGTTPKDTEQLSMKDIKQVVHALKGSKWVGLLGGEPTERADLLEIIKVFAKAGHKVILYTNGIKLLDKQYVRKLKQGGVYRVSLGVDSLSDEAIYIKMRNEKLLQKKIEVMENLRRSNIRTEILDVVVKNLNERSIGEIVRYCCQNQHVRQCTLRGYSHMGRRLFSSQEEFTLDELVEAAQNQTRNAVTLEEFYMFQRLLYVMRLFDGQGPQCYVRQSIYIPRKSARKMRDIFPPDKFNRYLDTFQELYKENTREAKRMLLRHISRAVIKNPIFFIPWSLGKIMPSFLSRAYIVLEASMFYTPDTIDLKKTGTRCSDVWLPSFKTGPAVDYCSFLCGKL